VAAFLSEEWFEQLNAVLRDAGPVPLESVAETFRVVIELTDAPADSPHAITLTLERTGASAHVGNIEGADAAIRLAFDDAQALTTGTFDSAGALREGRVKLRGDLNAITSALGWLQRAHPRAE
jgi:hypothetical protein